jgi:uncharacterized protein (DUF1800 family)
MSKTSIALNRFGYGLKLGEDLPRQPERYLLAQLDGYDPLPSTLKGRTDHSQKPGEILEMLRRLRMQRRMQASDMEASMEAQGANGANPLNGLPPEVQRSYRAAGQVLRDDVALRTNIAIKSSAPMVERLVHFWSNHFSVTAQKPGTHYQVADHEFKAIRPHVLGKFSDMLKAAALHPAMLLYLDQFQSIGPNSRFMRSRAARQRGNNNGGPRGLNENLAREVLELHTLGVDGGYDQADVTELAKALTGWTIQGISRVARFSEPQSNGAAFLSVAHEVGKRKVLGRSYSDTGNRQALDILDDLAAHPSTARFIATKLARHFAGDTPPDTLVKRLEADFLATGGDLASLTRTLIASPEAWEPQPVKFRAPFEWLVSVLRLTGVDGLNGQRLGGALNEIGQVPWRAPSPAGYDDIAESWASPDGIWRRTELAERIAQNLRPDRVVERAEMAFPEALSDETRLWLSRAETSRQALALLLVAPEMMRR